MPPQALRNREPRFSLAALMFFGLADELRGYYEAYPFLYILMLPSIYYGLLGYQGKEGGIP